MINICYMISHLENCGPVNILYGIIKNLDKNFFNVIIITLKKFLSKFFIIPYNIFTGPQFSR